ncbi:transposable element Tcb1 transposase, partial [Trichonephila clavipes]
GYDGPTGSITSTPQCTTSREDRQFLRMAVTHRSVTSRTVAQHIESVTHHSVFARTIRRRLQQNGLSTRRPLLGLAFDAEPQTSPPPMVLEPVVLPYHQGLATAIFQQDNARPHVVRIVERFFVNHQIKLLPRPARFSDLSPIENMWSMVAQRLTQITPQLPHQINFGNVWKLLGLLYTKNTSKVSLNQCRGVWQRWSPTMVAIMWLLILTGTTLHRSL